MIEARNTSLQASLCLVLALAACSSSDDGTGPDDTERGGFSVTLTGAFDASLSGYAWQSGTIVDSETDAQGWVLFLSTDAGGSTVYVVRQGDRPGPGTYPLVDLSEGGGLTDGQLGGIATVMLSGGLSFAGFTSGGTLTISSSSEGRVEGLFSIQFTGFDPETTKEVTITANGSFDAVANEFTFPGF